MLLHIKRGSYKRIWYVWSFYLSGSSLTYLSKSKPKTAQMLWSFASFFIVSFVYEFTFPDVVSTYNVKVRMACTAACLATNRRCPTQGYIKRELRSEPEDPRRVDGFVCVCDPVHARDAKGVCKEEVVAPTKGRSLSV
jgi:hypothetical protein